MDIKKILIGIDDSKYAENAAAFGFNLARTLKAAVGMVHIIEPVMMPPNVDDTTMGVPISTYPDVNTVELMNIQTEQSENVITRTVKNLAGDLEVTHFTEYGSTADGIIECSKTFNADMIIIGTHSRTGLDRLLMGSVAEHVVRYSEIPVLVVPFNS